MVVGERPAIAVLGGDAAVIAVPCTDPHGAQIYTGARGSLAIPVLAGAHGATEELRSSDAPERCDLAQ